jgi:hypothetical protein
VSAGSESEVYETVADAKSSWRRSFSAAVVRFARATLVREFRKDGATVRSFRRVPFPKIAGRVTACRAELRAQDVALYMDIVGLEHGFEHGARSRVARARSPARFLPES